MHDEYEMAPGDQRATHGKDHSTMTIEAKRVLLSW